jgi:hypothetical protein
MVFGKKKKQAEELTKIPSASILPNAVTSEDLEEIEDEEDTFEDEEEDEESNEEDVSEEDKEKINEVVKVEGENSIKQRQNSVIEKSDETSKNEQSLTNFEQKVVELLGSFDTRIIRLEAAFFRNGLR